MVRDSETIGLICGIFAICAYLVKISMSFSKMKTEIEENKKRDEEERCNNQRKFQELYESRNKTNDTLTELTTTIKMLIGNMDKQFATIDKQFSSLDKKIDELKEHVKD